MAAKLGHAAFLGPVRRHAWRLEFDWLTKKEGQYHADGRA